MKKVFLSTVALIAFAAPAAAADLAARPYTKAPPAPIAAVYDWSGFYIGANGGWGSSRKCWDFVDPVLGRIAEGCHDATGGTAGGQLGYRWQAGTWVFGLEGQGNWADFKGSNVSLIDPTLRNQSRIDAFGLFTGQATTPAGVPWSARASNSVSPPTGRPASNTTTCSCRIAPTPSSTRPVLPSAAIASARTSISSRCASTIVGVVR